MFCFIHIERAGGTTLHYIFRNNFLSYLTLTPWSYWANEEENVFSQGEAKWLLRLLPFTAGFGGHTVRAYLGYENCAGVNNIDYITFLRDPVKRYISHYNYQRKVMSIDWSIDSFMAESHFDNFMTKRVAGKYDIELAKKSLDERFAFVGFTDRIDESLLLMKNELKWKLFNPHYQRRNSSKDPQYADDPLFKDKTILAEIRKRNELDIELYEYALHTIYPKYKERFLGDLENELILFKSENNNYSFNKKRRMAWMAYRWAIYRNLEYIFMRLYHNNYEGKK